MIGYINLGKVQTINAYYWCTELFLELITQHDRQTSCQESLLAVIKACRHLLLSVEEICYCLSVLCIIVHVNYNAISNAPPQKKQDRKAFNRRELLN